MVPKNSHPARLRRLYSGHPASMCCRMLDTLKRVAIGFNLGAVASLLAHAIILALFVVDLDLLMPKPQETRAIEVELVSPKEQVPPKPQPKPEPKPEAAKKPTEPAAAKKPPEQPPAKKAAVEPPKPPSVLRPVVKFGEKDAGSKKQEAGDAARAAQPVNPPPPGAPLAKPAEPKPQPPQIAGIPQAAKPDAQAGSRPDPASLPVPAKETPKPANPAKQMRSPEGNESEETMTAKGDIPRGIRAGQLCATELRRQLTNANPPYWPDLLPAYRLDKGTVMEVRKGAFRANARWYNLEFRCEIDATATSVIALDFDVGAPVPRAEWKSRGFPGS